MIHVAVGIIRKNNEILIAKRPPGKPYSGYWEFPGGKIEPNETVEAALKRELHEELGIEISASQVLFEHTHSYPDKTVLLKIHLIDHFLGDPYGKEGQVLRWVNYPALLKLKLLEGNLSILAKLKEAFNCHE